jgi:hypothetical protein
MPRTLLEHQLSTAIRWLPSPSSYRDATFAAKVPSDALPSVELQHGEPPNVLLYEEPLTFSRLYDNDGNRWEVVVHLHIDEAKDDVSARRELAQAATRLSQQTGKRVELVHSGTDVDERTVYTVVKVRDPA